MSNYRRVVSTTHRFSRTSTAPAKFVANSLPKPLDMLSVYPCQTTICILVSRGKEKNGLEGKTNPSLLLELRQPNRKVFASCYLAEPSTPSPVCHLSSASSGELCSSMPMLPSNSTAYIPASNTCSIKVPTKFKRQISSPLLPFHPAKSRDGQKTQPHPSSEGRAASPLGCQG